MESTAASSRTPSAATPAARGGITVLLRFFLVAWLINALLLARALTGLHSATPSAAVFVVAVIVEYALLFLLPAALPSLLLARNWPRAASALALALAVATQMVLVVDGFVFQIYGYHLNGFVWNLIWTPGGLASMDATAATYWTAGALGVALLLIDLAALRAAQRWEWPWRWLESARPRRAAAIGVAGFVLLALGERLAFGIADFTGERSLTAAHEIVPFYVRARMRKLAGAFGYERRSDAVPEMRGSEGSLEYPLAPIRLDPQRRKWNVVWLVSESLRADALDAEVMPATFAFAQRAQWFRNHYSAGNGTRMGVFGMFYGLYGSYWFPFLAEHRGPVVVDRFVEDDYRMFVATSAKFSFPEFDKTIWSRVPRSQLLEGDGSLPGWQRDEGFVTKMIEHIDATPPGQPFFTFLFFESPHAQYRFPDSSVIRRPYADELNYATLSRVPPEQIPLIKNRYSNAVHHLDQQVGRVLRHLEERQLLDSTIVVITGDHGEEFWEKGRYGHHSTFSEEQTRTPLVVWLPGEAPREVHALTSHLDLAPTLLARLGVLNDPAEFSLGRDLIGGPARDHVVIADWDHLCVRDARWKGIFPINQRGFLGFELTTIDDAKDAAEDDYLKATQKLLSEVIRAQGRFLR